ncbi:MAG: hypothetical protein ACLU6P_17860 [Roseburia intestinalis]
MLFINATRSNGELQAGFTPIAEHTSVGKTGTIWYMEHFRCGNGMINSLIVSSLVQ